MTTTRQVATVPFYGVAREFARYRAEYMGRIEAVTASGRMLQGPQVEELEGRVADLTGRSRAVAVNSCTDALFFALLAVGVTPGDEVLVTDFSFAASATCILRAGARPVFVDITKEHTLDLERAHSLVTPRTRAMVFVHLYGRMAYPDPVEQFARYHGIALVEDAAQALMARSGKRAAGSMGAASCVSFDPTKIVGAPGSGGVLLTDDEDIASVARQLRYHGQGSNKGFDQLGYNSQMPSLTAALLTLKLDYAEAWLGRRREVAARYIESLSDVDALTLPADHADAPHTYHKFVVRAESRDGLQARLDSAGIETGVHYRTPLHREPVFGRGVAEDRDFPRAIQAADSVLSLPIHPFLTDDEVERVAGAVAGFYAHE